MLEELRELIDDEEPGVKFEALSVLPECLGHCTPEQIVNSGIVQEVAGIFLSACDLAVSPEMQSILVQQSVKVLHKVTDEALLNAVLKFFAVCISTQEKQTPESLKAELGLEVIEPKKKKLTFLESLASGDIDFLKLNDEQL